MKNSRELWSVRDTILVPTSLTWAEAMVILFALKKLDTATNDTAIPRIIDKMQKIMNKIENKWR